MKRFLLFSALVAMLAVSAPAVPPPAASAPAVAPPHVAIAATSVPVQPQVSGPSAKPKIAYSRDIEPILSANCYKCHGPDAEVRQAGLRLDERKSAVGKLESGDTAIVPGKPDEGELVRRIFSSDPDVRMPPPKARHQLSGTQKQLLKQWVAEGAVYSVHWSFVAPVRPALPAVHDARWSRNPIDRFILARLEREGLKPSPEADRTTLIRRVTLDLTGLPPTPAEVDAFLADVSSDAYEKVVDRLLASPHYGERLALDWLDAARYADTHGYHIDSGRDMWMWRDWVIDAFNRNMPFDQFTVEQLAGDLLPNATLPQRIASGFNRNNMVNMEGGAIPEEYLDAYIIDRVNTTSTVWMGLTMGCCECHDHKFDPLTSKDYYGLFAMFHNVPELGLDGIKGNAVPVLQVPSPQQQRQVQALKDHIADVQKRQEARAKEVAAAKTAWERKAASVNGLPPELGGLVAHFAMDEMKGSSVADATGILPPGIIRGRVQWKQGKIGGALEFDGETNVKLGNVLSVERDQRFSTGAWVRPTSTADCVIISRMDDDPYYRGWDLFLREGRPFVHLDNKWDVNAIRVNAKDPVPLNEWSHVLVTYDGSSKAAGLHIYVNGRPVEMQITNDNLSATIRTDKPARIGARNPKEAFIGLIDDVRFYNRELSPPEVFQLVVAGPVYKILALPLDQRTAEQTEQVRQFYFNVVDKPYQKLAAELVEAQSKLAVLDRAIPTTMVMQEMPKPRETFMLMRGQYDKLGQKVAAGVPAVLPPLPPGAPTNRLGLARWLVSPGHPLTARVIVNRFWQMVFGTGIVKTSEDFGTQGERPSHRELLDWLACEFESSGWNVRAMQRLIVTSAAYRQSSAVSPELLERDPENRLLARGPRVRLPAELIRDVALSASGLLNAKIGGPSVLPYQVPGLWEEMAIDSANDNYSAQRYVQSHGPDLYRRSMYTFWKRTVPPASLYTFDAPDRETCTVRRQRTNTPLQALVLMNDPTYVEASRKLAERMLTEISGGATGGTPADRITLAYRLVLARKPNSRELEVLGKLFDSQLAAYRQDKAGALKLLGVGESPYNKKLDPAELAAWSVVASAVLNLDETITSD